MLLTTASQQLKHQPKGSLLHRARIIPSIKGVFFSANATLEGTYAASNGLFLRLCFRSTAQNRVQTSLNATIRSILLDSGARQHENTGCPPSF